MHDSRHGHMNITITAGMQGMPGPCYDLDDLFLGAWQLEVAPVKALTLGGGTPHAVPPRGARLLMHRNHAGPHKEDAHIHVGACVCSSATRHRIARSSLHPCRRVSTIATAVLQD